MCMMYSETEKKNNPSKYDTVFIRDIISKCEDVEELKSKILPMLKDQKDQWSEKIGEIIEKNGYTKSAFAEACRVSRVSVDKWCKGAIPKNRETFLRIGMAAHYDRNQMDQLLQRYGQYPGLYPKSLEDCVCIFVLQKQYGESALGRYEAILDRIKTEIIKDNEPNLGEFSTVFVDERIRNITSEEDLQKFVSDNASIFSSAYHKFYAYVKICIKANYNGYAGSVFELAEGQGWSSSLRQCVSEIRQNKWYPTRNKIISLGLHLSMDHDQIDEMLELAHMEPLCAKNIFESVIMFVLDDASLNNMMDTQSEEYDPDELCRYARSVLEGLDLPEIEAFITELPEIDDE